MLEIIVPELELFNEKTQEFLSEPAFTLTFEHSLFSISKWESEFEKPFLSKGEKTTEETLAYVRCMLQSLDYPDNWEERLSPANLETISHYINSAKTATTFRDDGRKSKGRSETITAELVYYWMVSFNIPFECQYWHLNRLFALIRICQVKNSKQPKMSPREIAQRNRELNEQRRQQFGTAG